MPNRKTGQFFDCIVCGEPFYRRRSYILRGIRKTCGKRECKSAGMSGANNPFWGKSHSSATLAQINASRRARPTPQRKGGPPKGYKHTPEARAKMSEALKARWKENRDLMVQRLPRGEDHHFRKIGYEPRHRKNFTPVQKELWIGTECAWCRGTEKLVLDHIIPVMAGGQNVQSNAQTLCQPCNVWKMWFVDRPFYLASLGSKGG